MALRLQGRVAVVTGAASERGRAIALGLAREGAAVVVNGGTDGSGAADTARMVSAGGGNAAAVPADVTTPAGAQSLVQAAVERFGRLDILCNGAGASRPGAVWDLSEADWDLAIAAHLKAYFLPTKFASALMKERRSGRIVNLCPTAAVYGGGDDLTAGAVTGAIVAFTRSVARELGLHGATVNAICPGPSGAEPVAMATLAVFLATDAAADVNCQVFAVSGLEIGLVSPPTPVRTIHRDGRWPVDELQARLPGMIAAARG